LRKIRETGKPWNMESKAFRGKQGAEDGGTSRIPRAQHTASHHLILLTARTGARKRQGASKAERISSLDILRSFLDRDRRGRGHLPRHTLATWPQALSVRHPSRLAAASSTSATPAHPRTVPIDRTIPTWASPLSPVPQPSPRPILTIPAWSLANIRGLLKNSWLSYL
jgi:hypothetical protein